MTPQLGRAALTAFLSIVAAVALVSLAPVIVTGLMGKSVPDSLIAVSDKTVTGLIGVLGTLAGIIFRPSAKPGEPAGTPTLKDAPNG